MTKKLFEQLLAYVLSRFASPEKIKEYAELATRFGYRLVDMLVAAAVTAILAYLNRPDDGIILGVWGDTPAQAVGSASVAFVLISILRYVGPILLQSIKVWLGVAAVLLLLVSQVNAAGIDGPSQSPTGRLIKLTAKVDAKSKIAWFAFPPDKADSIFLDNQLIFTGPPGRYVVYLVEFPEAGGQSQVMTTIDILDGVTPPGPGPSPTPGPGPLPLPLPPTPPAPSPLPDGQFKLAAWAYQNAKPINDPAGAAALSGAVKGMLAAYAAGTMKAADLLPSLSSAIRERGPSWDKFRKDLAAELNRQGFRSRPPADWVTAGNELVAGLDAVK